MTAQENRPETGTATTAGTRQRSPQRLQCLADMLCGAIENGGYGWFRTVTWHCPSDRHADWYAQIEDGSDDGTAYRVDLDTIARGLSVIRRAVGSVDDRYPDDGPVLHNADTGERLYLSGERRTEIGRADRTNGEDGDLDVVDCLAILECGLFGRVVYA